MFKLLTEEALEKVRGEYNRRRAVVVMILAIVVLLVAIVGLLPSYVLSSIRQEEVEEMARIISESKARGDEAELEAWLRDINLKLQALSPTSSVSPSLLIGKVTDKKIGGVRLANFLWSSERLLIRGIARDRQILIEFKDRLSTSGQFKEVNLPLSDLAQDRDIEFQISLTPSSTP